MSKREESLRELEELLDKSLREAEEILEEWTISPEAELTALSAELEEITRRLDSGEPIEEIPLSELDSLLQAYSEEPETNYHEKRRRSLENDQRGRKRAKGK